VPEQHCEFVWLAFAVQLGRPMIGNGHASDRYEGDPRTGAQY
jgi:hypothetical protein